MMRFARAQERPRVWTMTTDRIEELEFIDQGIAAELDEFPDALQRIAMRAQSVLSRIGKRVSRHDVEFLKSSFAKPTYEYIDYDQFGEAFAYEYFIRNFWKAAGTFLKERPPLARRVVDAGTGSGATILAYLGFINEFVSDSKWKINVLLIDRSEVQLELVSSLLHNAIGELTNLDLTITFLNSDLRDWQPERNSADSILFGHVLTENKDNIDFFLEKAFSGVSENGRVYIIERKDDAIWSDIYMRSAELALPICRGSVLVRVGVVGSMMRLTEAAYPEIRTKFLTLHIPEKKVVAELLRRYFDAWKTRSLSSLETIFSQDAEYHDKPHKSPFRGIEEVKRYWKEHVLTQKNIDLRILRVAYSGTDGFAEWEATFVQSETRVRLRGTLIIKANPEVSRAVALHEYYQSIKSPY